MLSSILSASLLPRFLLVQRGRKPTGIRQLATLVAQYITRLGIQHWVIINQSCKILSIYLIMHNLTMAY